MDDDKWAQNLAREIKERSENTKAERSKFLAEHQLKQAHAPKLWEETRACMKKRVDLLNTTLGEVKLNWLSVKANEVRVKIGLDSPNDGIASFDPDTLEISVIAMSSLASYTPRLRNGDVVLGSKSGTFQTPDQIAQSFVSEMAKFITL